MSGPQQPAGSAPAHIVVAEDEPDLRTNLGRLLRLEGFRVSLAASGVQALQLVREDLPRLPDLLVTDLMMPGMNGLELMRALRGDHRTASLAVVLVTARVDLDALPGDLGGLARACVAKPYHRASLLACVRGVLASAAAARSPEPGA